MITNRVFLRLSELHIIKPFDCEEEDIDLKEFLFEDALLYLKQFLAVDLYYRRRRLYYSLFQYIKR